MLPSWWLTHEIYCIFYLTQWNIEQLEIMKDHCVTKEPNMKKATTKLDRWGLRQTFVRLFCKRPHDEYSLTLWTTQLLASLFILPLKYKCSHSEKKNEWVWPCSNTSLFPKQNLRFGLAPWTIVYLSLQLPGAGGGVEISGFRNKEPQAKDDLGDQGNLNVPRES